MGGGGIRMESTEIKVFRKYYITIIAKTVA